MDLEWTAYGCQLLVRPLKGTTTLNFQMNWVKVFMRLATDTFNWPLVPYSKLNIYLPIPVHVGMPVDLEWKLLVRPRKGKTTLNCQMNWV